MSTQTTVPASKASIVKGYIGCAHALVLLVLIQAVIAGNYERFGYGSWSIVPHGILGNVSFLLAVAAMVLTIVGKLPKRLLTIAVVLVVLMTAQIGMGYSVENNETLGAWHIPLGVLIFGLAVWQSSVAMHQVGRRARAEAAAGR